MFNTNFRISEITPVCPYCDNDELEYNEFNFGIDDSGILHCEKCGNKFRVSIFMAYDTEADCALNGNEHDWGKIEILGLERSYCKNCPSSKIDLDDNI